MSYQKPEVKKIVLKLEVNTAANQQSSCYGGRCVKARYEKDH